MVLVERGDTHQPVHSMLRAQQSVGARSSRYERRALEPRLFAGRRVDDLGLEALALGPLEVHAHEHLNPVLRLYPTLTDGQRDHGVVVGERIGEQQVQLARSQVIEDRGSFLVQLPFQVRIAARELVELDQVAGALLQSVPGPARLHQLGVELVGALAFGWKVKGAPSAARSAPRALWD